MKEREIINKIGELKSIKPNEEWVFSAKRQIFEGEFPVIQAKPEFTFNFFSRSAFAFSLMAIIAVSTGFVLYSSNLNDLKVAQNKYEREIAKIQELTPTLESLQLSLAQAKEGLDNAKLSDPREVLIVGKSLDSAVKTGREVLAEAKKMTTEDTTSEEMNVAENLKIGEPENEALASINDAEKAVEDLENNYKLFVSKVIEDVSHWYLGPAEMEKLEEAREEHENENYNQALEAIYSISYPEY